MDELTPEALDDFLKSLPSPVLVSVNDFFEIMKTANDTMPRNVSIETQWYWLESRVKALCMFLIAHHHTLRDESTIGTIVTVGMIAQLGSLPQNLALSIAKFQNKVNENLAGQHVDNLTQMKTSLEKLLKKEVDKK